MAELTSEGFYIANEASFGIMHGKNLQNNFNDVRLKICN